MTTTTHNAKLQGDLMRAIAVRAVMNASGDNCFCPVKKPTKFIVTLKPVVKVPNADPFLNIQPTFSACICNTQSSQKTTLTPEQIQVRNNTEALKGKTLLNAFRVLTNSKFISIDPKYNYGDSGILSPSCDKLRLSGGGWGKCSTNENILQHAGEPLANQSACDCQHKFAAPAPENVTLSKCAKSPSQAKSSNEIICKQDRMYHILQRSCHEKTLGKIPPKCRIVCPSGEYDEQVKVPKKKMPRPVKKQTELKERTQKPTKERAELRRELERIDEAPTCVEKAVGTSDYPCDTPLQQESQSQTEKNSRAPLKYFGLNCANTKKAEDETCEEKPPCPLSMLPFPGIRKPTASAVEPDCACQAGTEPQQHGKDAQYQLSMFPYPSIRKVEPCDEAQPAKATIQQHYEVPQPTLTCAAPAVQPPAREKEVHYEPKPRPPDISSEIIAQQCHRIQKLEQQVNEMRHELSKMKNEIIPPDDMLRCTALTSKLHELTALLADLKNRHAEAIATVIMAQRQQQATCRDIPEKNDRTPPYAATPARVVSPTRAVSPERAVSPARIVSPSPAAYASPAYATSRAVSPARAVSPTCAASPARSVSPSHAASPAYAPSRAASPSHAASPVRPASPSRTQFAAQHRPEMRAEQVQTCFADNYKDQLSQTNASFGWRPFIDEATQSSPPSTVRVTPTNTSSAPPSSHTSSAVSASLPCRHNTGEIPLKSSPSFCPHCQRSEYPRCIYVDTNLCGEIMTLLQQHPPCEVLLSVLLQPNNLYHVNISLTSTGEPLGCIYATEQAINEACEADVFNRFLTFFIVDARISVQQKDKILAHTFEFFKN